MWRYGDVYERMRNDPRFEPTIVTAPRINQPKASYIREQREMVDYFANKGYPVTKGFDDNKDKWISLQSIKPDIIFYTQPYDGLLPASFEYWHNLRSLICYTPYSFQFSRVGWNWDNAVQNYAWKHYVSLPFHAELCREHSRIKARNAVPVGYFFEEEYAKALQNKANIDAVWKNDARKRIIWAPHHSIFPDSLFKTSSFLDICDEITQLRDKFCDKIIIAFKPHPMLRENLYHLWSKEKTDSFYSNWANSPNSFLHEGSFVDLFAGSCAMIHCSGSFIIDYLYTRKPVQYVYSRNRNAPEFGDIANVAIAAHYPAHNIKDIEDFLTNVVINGQDLLRDRRETAYQQNLSAPNSKSFSENVVQDILKGIPSET